MACPHFAERDGIIARKSQREAVVILAAPRAPAFDDMRQQHYGAALAQVAGIRGGDLEMGHGVQHRVEGFQPREEAGAVLGDGLQVRNGDGARRIERADARAA